MVCCELAPAGIDGRVGLLGGLPAFGVGKDSAGLARRSATGARHCLPPPTARSASAALAMAKGSRQGQGQVCPGLSPFGYGKGTGLEERSQQRSKTITPTAAAGLTGLFSTAGQVMARE